MKLRLFLLMLILGWSFDAYTQTRTPPGNYYGPYFKLLESYTQRIIPGQKRSLPLSSAHFIIIWDAKIPPESFFWRGDSGFFSCNVVKVHKIIQQNNFPPGMGYTEESIAGHIIKSGDTIELTPAVNGKFPVPFQIPQDAVNTLFFKTASSGWLSFPVKNITRKRDIVMP